MHPDVTLKELMDIVRDYNRGRSIPLPYLIKLVENLDAWMSSGGYPPKDWSQ